MSITLYPNPVKDNLSVNLTGLQSDDYTLIISDASGKILQTKNCHVSQDAAMLNIPFTAYIW
ncbi:MAG TPA: T9SS type A sorting domain-containing protein [Chitinophagaceae bacterium]|nr:T9SS type A sorting domain-containing protein [Chitinophagaceae bacterium]